MVRFGGGEDERGWIAGAHDERDERLMRTRRRRWERQVCKLKASCLVVPLRALETNRILAVTWVNLYCCI
jgi:hypothetical protein